MVDSTLHWAPPLACNRVAWLATTLGSSPQVIDLNELSKIVGLALPKVPLRHCTSIPIAIARQIANLHADLNDLHTTIVAIYTLQVHWLVVLLVPTPSCPLDRCAVVV